MAAGSAACLHDSCGCPAMACTVRFNIGSTSLRSVTKVDTNDFRRGESVVPARLYEEASEHRTVSKKRRFLRRPFSRHIIIIDSVPFRASHPLRLCSAQKGTNPKTRRTAETRRRRFRSGRAVPSVGAPTAESSQASTHRFSAA